MEKVLLVYPGQSESLVKNIEIPIADYEFRPLADNETYFRLFTNVKGKELIILCSLEDPNSKIPEICFIADAARESGAEKVTLLSPYLGYMINDYPIFNGQVVSSKTIGKIISSFFYKLITIDPILDKINGLSEILSIEYQIITSATVISNYVKEKIKKAFLICPENLNEDFKSELRESSGLKLLEYKKNRSGDYEFNGENINEYVYHTPVLIENNIKDGTKVLDIIDYLNSRGFNDLNCICIHGLFHGNTYEAIFDKGALSVHSTNTLPHISNRLDLSRLLARSIA